MKSEQIKYLPGVEPLFLKGSRNKGILLLHGIGGGTTWDLKEFASYANNRGYTIWLPALPGFGTNPNDLLGVHFEDWLTTASQGIEKLQKSCSSISIVGHSGGAAIGLILASHNREITRVVSWAGLWKPKHPLVPFLPFLLKIPVLRKIVPEREPLRIPQHLKDMGWVGYDYLPTRFVPTVLEGLKQLYASINAIECPVMVVQGSLDESVKVYSAQKIYEKISNPKKIIWIIEGASHPLMQDFCKDELFHRSLDFIDADDD